MVTILSVITLILGILFFSKEDTNNIVETIPDDMISIYFPTIISNQFGSKEETTSILAPLVETFVAMELESASSIDKYFTDNMDNIIFSQINSNWIDSIYSDILIELTSKYFQKHKLFAMDDIENKLAKKGAMIDFNQPPIIEKADGNMQEVMSLLGSALNDDVRIIAIKDIMEVGISTIQLIYIYGMNPTLDGNDIFIIYEEFEASTDDDSNWSFTGGLNVALSKSQDLVDDIIAEIEEDILFYFQNFLVQLLVKMVLKYLLKLIH